MRNQTFLIEGNSLNPHRVSCVVLIRILSPSFFAFWDICVILKLKVSNAHCRVADAYTYPHPATPPPGKYPDLIFQATDTVRALSLFPQHTLLCQGFTSITRNATPQWLLAHSNYCRGGSSNFAEAEDILGTANDDN